MTIDTKQVRKRIHDYLATGGLFNPELANHDAVRDLIMDCADEIDLLRKRETDRVDAAAATHVKYITEKRRAEAAEAKLAMVRENIEEAMEAAAWFRHHMNGICDEQAANVEAPLAQALNHLRVPELENSDERTD